jgi:hypothetical protein
MYPDIRLKRTVSPSEVVGIWTLTKESFEDIKTDTEAKSLQGPHTDFTINLKPDGTVVYRSLLQMPVRKVDCSGRWEVRPSYNARNSSMLTLYFDANGEHQHSLEFTEEQGNLVIWEYLGDPDSWRLVEYKK